MTLNCFFYKSFIYINSVTKCGDGTIVSKRAYNQRATARLKNGQKSERVQNILKKFDLDVDTALPELDTSGNNFLKSMAARAKAWEVRRQAMGPIFDYMKSAGAQYLELKQKALETDMYLQELEKELQAENINPLTDKRYIRGQKLLLEQLKHAESIKFKEKKLDKELAARKSSHGGDSDVAFVIEVGDDEDGI